MLGNGGRKAAFNIYIVLTYIKLYPCYMCLHAGVHMSVCPVCTHRYIPVSTLMYMTVCLYTCPRGPLLGCTCIWYHH